jgi:thioredoxin-related protein
VKLKLLLVQLFFALFLNAENIAWQGDYEKALLQAKDANKNILLFIRKKGCGDCQKMFETTLKDEEIVSALNKKYICVIATFEDKNSYPIEAFYTQAFPAIFFVSRHDELFLDKPIFGFIDKSAFKKKI